MLLMMVMVLLLEDLMTMTTTLHLLTLMALLALMEDHLKTTLSPSVDHMDHLEEADLKTEEDHHH